jgi:hypothetical protein
METLMLVDATDRTISEEIVRARDALIQFASENPAKAWTAHELKVGARNGGSSAVMGLALRQLLDERIFEEDADLRVRLRA